MQTETQELPTVTMPGKDYAELMEIKKNQEQIVFALQKISKLLDKAVDRILNIEKYLK